MSATRETPALTQPYPGLRPFLQGESKLFFGRADEINRMRACLEDNRFLAVVGGSGSGKSSLVRAGLLPVLELGYLLGAGTDWRFVVMRPGGDPFGNLAAEFHRAVEDDGEEPDAGDLAFTQASLQTSPRGFLEVVEEAGLGEGVPLLLLVDQFEEIFRFRRRRAGSGSAGEGERAIHEERNDATAFVNLLLTTAEAAAQAELPIYVVITMRSDFIGDCEVFPNLPQAVSDSQFLVPRMSRRQMQEVIEKPLLLFGCKAAPDLINQLLNDSATALDQLPLMQHALMRTWFAAEARWKEAGAERILTREDYDKVGGFSSALSMHLEEAWAELEEEREQRIARHLFLLMRKGGKSGALTRRMTTAREVAEVADADVETVARIVEVFQRDHRNFIVTSLSGTLRADSDLDISHEALLRQWERLGRWGDIEADSAEHYLDLIKVARQWKRGEAGTWRPPELDRSLQWRDEARPTPAWARRYGGDFELAMEFLDASREETENSVREKETQARQLRRNKLAVWAVLVPLLALSVITAVIFGMYRQATEARAEAVFESVQADKARDLADARSLALNAIQAGKKDPELAVLLAIEATQAMMASDKSKETVPPEIEASLRTSLASSYVRQRFAEHTSPDVGSSPRIFSLDVHPGGQLVVTGGEWRDGTARIWNLRTGKQLAVLDHDGTSVSQAKFSPDGTKILCATWRNGGHAYVWGAPVQPDSEQTVRKAIGDELLHFEKHPDYVTSAAWHPAGNLVATGCRYLPGKGEPKAVVSDPGTRLLVWNPETGEVDKNLDFGSGRLEHPGRISSLAYSPDGERLLSTTWETWKVEGKEMKSGRIVVWNLKAPDPEEPVHDPEPEREDEVPDSAVSAATPDPDELVDAPVSEESVTTPDPEASAEIEPISPGSDILEPDKVTPDQHPMIVWENSDAHSQEWVYVGAFSPDGNLIATGGGDKELRVWDARTGRQLASQIHGDPVMAVAFLDDRHIITGSDDSVVRIWSMEWVRNGVEGTKRDARREESSLLLLREEGTFRGHKKRVRSAGATADGRFIVSASDDGSALVWKRPPGEEVSALADPGEDYWCADVYFHAPEGEDPYVRAYCGTTNGEVHVYDAMTGERLEDKNFVGGHARGRKIRAISVHPDGDLLVTASSDQTVVVWDIEAGRPAYPPITGHQTQEDAAGTTIWQGGVVYSARFSPEGDYIATASDDGTVRLWNTSDGSPVLLDDDKPWMLSLHRGGKKSGRFYDARFSRGGSRIVAAAYDSNSAWICDAKTGMRLREIKGYHPKEAPDGHRDHVVAAAFSDDGESVVTASMDGTCRIWNAENGELVRVINHHVSVRSAEFSPDGNILLTAASDGVARIYQLPEYTLRSGLRGQTEVATVARFSRDGGFVIRWEFGGAAQVHYSDPWAVYELALSRVTRRLTAQEWEQYDVKRELSDREKQYYIDRNLPVPGMKESSTSR